METSQILGALIIGSLITAGIAVTARVHGWAETLMGLAFTVVVTALFLLGLGLLVGWESF